MDILNQYYDERENDKSDALKFSLAAEDLEGKKVSSWGVNTFLRYFFKLRGLKFTIPEYDSIINGRSAGSMKNIVARCTDNKQVKQYLDNSVLNWDAIKEKHSWRFKEEKYPTLEKLIYNFSILIKDVEEFGGSKSRTHRISETDKGDFKSPW